MPSDVLAIAIERRKRCLRKGCHHTAIFKFRPFCGERCLAMWTDERLNANLGAVSGALLAKLGVSAS